MVFEQSFELTDSNIQKYLQDFQDFLKTKVFMIDKKRQDFFSAVQELFNMHKTVYGSDQVCTVRLMKTVFNIYFLIECRGPEKHPFSYENDFLKSVCKSYNIGPTYRYSNGVGTTTLNFKYRRSNMLQKIVIAAVLGLLTMLVCKNSSSEFSGLLIGLVSPLFSKIVNCFSELATPLIFLAISLGILSIGDASTFGQIGGTLGKRMIVTYVYAALVSMGVSLLFFGGDFSTVSSTGGKLDGGLYKLLLDAVPDDLISPFQNNNNLQVMVLAIFFGVTLLLVKANIPSVSKWLSDLSTIVNKMMGLLCKLLPLLVYLGIVNMSSAENQVDMSVVLYGALAFIVSFVLVTGFVMIRTRKEVGVPLKLLIKKQWPSMMINLATSSQVTAFPESLKCCKERYGINPSLVDFAFPSGMVLYMPNGTALFAVAFWMLLVMGGTPFTVVLLLKFFLLLIIVIIAAPPIPGSALVILPIFMTTLGVSTDLMPLAILFVSILGYILPFLNGICLHFEILSGANKLNMVDRQVLEKNMDL